MANKKKSNAPEPIKPINTGGYFHKSMPPTIPQANYETWCKADLWTIERGILLLLGAEHIPYGGYGEREFYKAYQDNFNKIWAIAESSLKTGVLKKIGKSYPSLLSEVLPGDFINWARLKGYSIPAELEKINTVTQPETVGDGADTPPKQTDNEAVKLWLIIDPKDPNPKQPWYTPARYFARQLVKDNPTLLTKRNLLAGKVVQSLTNVGIKKRGGVKPFNSNTVLKAFSNVSLG